MTDAQSSELQISPMRHRRVLLVSYWYPPAIGAAAERMHGFSKHLPANGWSVDVLTTSQGANSAQAGGTDASRAPAGEIVAVADPWSGGRSVIGEYDPRRANRSRVRQFLREMLFPDRFVRWHRAAIRAGGQLIARRRPDLILVSFPPASAVLAALALHDETCIPMVLDYRDLWIGPGGYEPTRRGAIRKHRELERRAVRASAGVIGVSREVVDDIVERYRYPAERVLPVFNGFEPNPDAGILNEPPVANRSDQRLIVAHVGTVIERNRPELFFRSIQEMLREYVRGSNEAAAGLGVGRPRRVRFRFVGNLSADFLQDSALDGWVESTGLVSREAARQEMSDADALLLLTGAYVGRWGYSAKLFEYLLTGRPILCLEESPGSNDARVLREVAPRRSFFARLGDEKGLAEQIGLIRAYLANEPETLVVSEHLDKFSRAMQAGVLAAFLTKMMAET